VVGSYQFIDNGQLKLGVGVAADEVLQQLGVGEIRGVMVVGLTVNSLHRGLEILPEPGVLAEVLVVESELLFVGRLLPSQPDVLVEEVDFNHLAAVRVIMRLFV
jgi:hypothetical protein